jgi:iron complex outermembrane receptor protein
MRNTFSALVFAMAVSCCTGMLVEVPAFADDAEPEAARASDAEPPASEPTIRFDPIVVTASRIAQPLRSVPAAISVVEKPDIQQGRQTISLDEPLNRVPGVLVQNSGNFAQDTRVQIRGFGTRAAFGLREIRVLVDGLPETLPDGQTQIDGIDLGAVERIEVLRGPASSLYGNASGGVIQLFTEDGPAKPSAQTRLMAGSYDLGKYEIKGGGRAGNAQLFLHSSYLHLDGFRDHGDTQAATLTGKLRYDVGDHTDVTILINGVHSPLADDAGGLTRQEVEEDRRQARALNLVQDAGEAVEQGRIGLVGRRYGEQSELSAYAYFLYRDFENQLPIPPSVPPEAGGVVTFHRRSPGGGARYVLQRPVLGWPSTVIAGLDAQYQDDDRRRFANVGGNRGALGLHQIERVTGVGPYLRGAVTLLEGLEANAGVRYDNIHFEVDVDTPPGSTDSGSRTMEAWSPSGGLSYSPRAWLSLFANAGTAFQVPTTTELANPNGPGFNPTLDPQTATSYELGGRGSWREVADGGLAAFVVDIDDELIPFESPSGRVAFRNAGRSRRYGLEVDWQARPLAALRWSGAVTWIAAEFRSYATEIGTFDGNDEPGIPEWQVYQEIAYRHRSGLYAALEAFLVDGYFVDDANTARSPSYELVNLRAGFERLLGRWSVEPFVGLNNLTDADYDGTVRLNAVGGRFFEPAPGFNVYGGVVVAVQL